MRYALILLAALPALSIAGPEAAPPVQSEVFTTSGTQTEIAKRGEVCIARLVRNESMGGQATGSTIASSVPDAGLVVANSRITVKSLLMNQVVQSVLTFESKDGRFRITHTDMKFADPGPFSHFTPVYARTPLAKSVATALQKFSGDIAACVQQPASDF
jgi:hypothetical protein